MFTPFWWYEFDLGERNGRMTLRVQPREVVCNGPENRFATTGNGVLVRSVAILSTPVVLHGQWPGLPLPGSGNHVSGGPVNANRILINIVTCSSNRYAASV